MILALKKNLTFIVIILVLIAVCASLYCLYDSARKESERQTSNFNNMEKMYNNLDKSYAIQLQLSEDEFAQRYQELADSLSIKIGRIKEITKIKIKKQTDTIINWQHVYLPGDTVYLGKKVELKDTCYKLTVFEPKDSNFVQVKSDISIDAYCVVHLGKRKKEAKLFGWTVFRYGKRQTDVDAFLNCNQAKINITNIKVSE